jgi:hypothetical protein
MDFFEEKNKNEFVGWFVVKERNNNGFLRSETVEPMSDGVITEQRPHRARRGSYESWKKDHSEHVDNINQKTKGFLGAIYDKNTATKSSQAAIHEKNVKRMPLGIQLPAVKRGGTILSKRIPAPKQFTLRERIMKSEIDRTTLTKPRLGRGAIVVIRPPSAVDSDLSKYTIRTAVEAAWRPVTTVLPQESKQEEQTEEGDSSEDAQSKECEPGAKDQSEICKSGAEGMTSDTPSGSLAGPTNRVTLQHTYALQLVDLSSCNRVTPLKAALAEQLPLTGQF